MILSKNVFNKKCGPELVFFNEKKWRKIRMIFDLENWLWKSNFGTFWQLTTTPILKIQSFRFGMLILLYFVPPAWKLENPYCCSVRILRKTPRLNYIPGDILMHLFSFQKSLCSKGTEMMQKKGFYAKKQKLFSNWICTLSLL